VALTKIMNRIVVSPTGSEPDVRCPESLALQSRRTTPARIDKSSNFFCAKEVTGPRKRYPAKALILRRSNWLRFANHSVRRISTISKLYLHYTRYACCGQACFELPLTLRRFGADPCTASSIFLTTGTDIASMGLMLGLATVLVL
jgi:hypothetical protein